MSNKSWCVIFCAIFLTALPSRAEKDEKVAGVNAGLVFPSFKSTSPTAFALTGWSIAPTAQYGVTNDLALGFTFELTSFSGEAVDYQITQDNQAYEGSLRFAGRLYHPQVFAEYKLYAGYNLAPYIEISGGYCWATYLNPDLVNKDNRSFALNIKDFAEDSFTVSAAISVDLRVLNLFMVGVAPKYTYFASGTLRHMVTIPATLSYYW